MFFSISVTTILASAERETPSQLLSHAPVLKAGFEGIALKVVIQKRERKVLRAP